jgi:hypothetical protein
MSAGWTLVLMAVCTTVGWLLGTHFTELDVIERRKVRRIHEAAVRDDRVAR